MSKSVRLKDHLVAEVERLAAEERRSLAQMVELLLEQALKMDGLPTTKETVQTEPIYVQTQTTTTPRAERRAAEPVTASVRTDRPTPSECGMSNRHSMNSKLKPCPRCGYPTVEEKP